MIRSKKGVIPLLFLAIALFVGLGIAMVVVYSLSPELEFVGESSVLILTSQELQENAFDYLDHSIRLASLNAFNTLKNENMFLDDKKECGEVAYPVFLNISKNCVPDYESNYLEYFEREFNKIIRHSIYPEAMYGYFTYELDNDNLRVNSLTPLRTNIFSSLEDYKVMHDNYIVRNLPTNTLIPGFVTTTVNLESLSRVRVRVSYVFEKFGLKSNPRSPSQSIDKVILYAENGSALELFDRLQNTGRGYHYYVTNERVFRFVPDNMKTYHVICDVCDKENYHSTGIAIALQDCDDCDRRNENLKTLLELLSIWHRDLTLSVNSIILHADISDVDEKNVNINIGDLI